MAIIASILTVITIASCLSMFFIRRELRAALLLMGTITLTLVNIPGVPLHKANFLLPICFLLSEWQYLLSHIKEIWNTPALRIALAIVILSTIVCALTTRYVGFISVIREELVFKYFAICYAFMAIDDEGSLKPVLNVSLYCLIALTVFGILNYIDRSAELVNALTRGKTSMIFEDQALGDVYATSARFRVLAMFKSPFDYGYICAAMLLLHMHAWHRYLESKVDFVIAVACCLFGVITCGCRIVWAASLFSVICYYVCCFRVSKNVLLGIAAVVLLVMSYNFIPAVEQKVNSVTDVFKENSETRGSSIAMRTTQMTKTFYYVRGHELMGKGKGYFIKEILKPSLENRETTGLQGLESVVFAYILERGYVGLSLWIAFYAVIFVYFWRNRQTMQQLTGLGISILSLYMVFAIGTGELSSVYPTMLLLGFVIKAVESGKPT